VQSRDPHVQGIVILGLGQSEAELAAAFRLAAPFALVKGFAVGRTIHADMGRAFLAGQIDEATAVATMAENYRRLCGIWDQARATGVPT
jgi:5-dehydro-2-deoxygluconokinase